MKKRLLFLTLLIAGLSIGYLFYLDEEKRKITFDKQELSRLKSARQNLLDNKTKLLESIKPFSLSDARPHSLCDGRYFFADTYIIDNDKLPTDLKNSFSKAWLNPDNTIAFVTKETSGIGFFPDYIHEIVHDPLNKIKIQSLDSNCYATIQIADLGDNWKYRIVSTQWD